MTPLHVAAEGNRIETVKHLVLAENDIDIDIKDTDGVSTQGTLVIFMEHISTANRSFLRHPHPLPFIPKS